MLGMSGVILQHIQHLPQLQGEHLHDFATPKLNVTALLHFVDKHHI